MKEIRALSGEVEECDQCDYKTTKVNAMKDHKRVKHVGEKKKCSKCEYSHVYPTKIRQHYKQVHDKIRPQWSQRMHSCREKSCKDFGTPSCLKIETHSLYFCNLCPSLSFKRSDKLKFHVDKVHKGITFKCEHCPFSNARKFQLKKHILMIHTKQESPMQESLIKSKAFCIEEGCSYSTVHGDLKRHIATKHEGLIKFKCQVMNCNYASERNREMQNHLEKHRRKK